MHREISSRLALEIILLLAILVGGYTIIKRKSLNEIYIAPAVNKSSNILNTASNEQCKTHIYEGGAAIHGWYVNSGNDLLIVVADEDIKSLPNYDGTQEYIAKNKQIKLVDLTPALEKKLKQTSENKPQLITITGYAIRCNDIPLASISYKDGVFNKYLNF